jgi:hypothetical protein
MDGCSTNGGKRNTYRLFVVKPEGKRPLGRPRYRWMDINMDLQEMGCGGVDWIGLPQERNRWRTLVTSIKNAGKLQSVLITGGPLEKYSAP